MLSSTTINLLFVVACAAPAVAGIISAPEHLPSSKFDFVIIGGGTAGNVVANRLTEDPNVAVLVLEAGVTDQGVENAVVPAFAPRLSPNTKYTWNFTTTPQPGLNNRTVPYPRGRILGGSSTINYEVFTRGSSDDFDRYANVTGDQGWSWNALGKHMKKIEGFVQPQDNRNTTGQYDPKVHGDRGPILVTLSGFPTEIDNKVFDTVHELDEFPFNLDMNSGDTIGIGWGQYSFGGGRRSDSATGYLTSKVLNRPNLHVLLDAQVTKITPNWVDQFGRPIFDCVEFSHGSLSNRSTVCAKKEIILSAGAIGTPQLLMLSGIGDKAALSSLDINTRIDLPDVGKNLQDHALLLHQFYVNSNDTVDNAARNATLAEAELRRYNETRTGPLVNGAAGQIGWLRLPSNATIFESIADPTAGPKSAHYELLFSNGYSDFFVPLPATGNFFTITTNLISPVSRGSVTLNSSDPFNFPLINPALLTSPFDLFTLREAVKSVRRFVAATPWEGYIIKPFREGFSATTDEAIDAYVRNFTVTVWHPIGTAAMSANDEKSGVVNPDLLVKGAAGLRIVDASVLPFIPSAHPQAAVYMIAERAADLIKATWNLK